MVSVILLHCSLMLNGKRQRIRIIMDQLSTFLILYVHDNRRVSGSFIHCVIQPVDANVEIGGLVGRTRLVIGF